MKPDDPRLVESHKRITEHIAKLDDFIVTVLKYHVSVEQLMTDLEGDPLLEGLAAGRDDAFAALYDRLGVELFRVACAMLECREDAADAVQEVFIGLFRARRTFREIKNLRAYVFAALRREAARLWAKRKLRRSLPLDRADELAVRQMDASASDEAVGLERAVHSLPPEQRELIALKIDGGLTFAEIGKILGINPNTAASRYRYALEKLRASLAAR